MFVICWHRYNLCSYSPYSVVHAYGGNGGHWSPSGLSQISNWEKVRYQFEVSPLGSPLENYQIPRKSPDFNKYLCGPLLHRLCHAPGYQQKFRPKIQFWKMFEINLNHFKSCTRWCIFDIENKILQKKWFLRPLRSYGHFSFFTQNSISE